MTRAAIKGRRIKRRVATRSRRWQAVQREVGR